MLADVSAASSHCSATLTVAFNHSFITHSDRDSRDTSIPHDSEMFRDLRERGLF